jgi:fructokinase
MSIWVCGEVLIDLLPGSPERLAVVGGGPANTAKALARLGHDVQFIDGISTDEYGQSARAELLADEVKLDLALTSDKPTCLAIVTWLKMAAAHTNLRLMARQLLISR